MVALVGFPPGFLDDLPVEEQLSISEIVGKPIKFCGISSGMFRSSRWERAELAFSDRKRGMNHTLHVDPSFIRPIE
jgi:hypothetical protein